MAKAATDGPHHELCLGNLSFLEAAVRVVMPQEEAPAALAFTHAGGARPLAKAIPYPALAMPLPSASRNLIHLRIGHLSGGNGWGLLVLLEVLGHCRSRNRGS